MSDYYSKQLTNVIQQAYKGIPDLAKFWMPDNLQNRFLLEAKRLWELDLGISRLTSIHAAQVLHGVLNGNGLSTVGDFYTSQAVTMAHNLRIFEPAPIQMSLRFRRGREFTAWALWLWQVGVVSQSLSDTLAHALIYLDGFVQLSLLNLLTFT